MLLAGNGSARREPKNLSSRCPASRDSRSFDLARFGPDPLCSSAEFWTARFTGPARRNFALQNSDLLLVVGSRLDMAMTAYSHERTAGGAAKIMVDIDATEIRKMKTPIHLPIVADATAFLVEFKAQCVRVHAGEWEAWVGRCRDWKVRFPSSCRNIALWPVILSMYHFSEALSDEFAAGDVITPGSSGFAIEIFLLCLRSSSWPAALS